MKNQKGFTLLELLVASTILGILVVFATTSYRNSVAENRWAQARAMTNQLAGSLQRVKMDYPSVSFKEEIMQNVDYDGKCPFDMQESSFPEVFQAGDLTTCGYMESGAWTNTSFEYMICGTTPTGEICSKKDGENFPLACVKARDTARLPDQFKTNTYCVYETGKGIECRKKDSEEKCVSL
ncbi:MAG: prepilin-type N-terminal cleavage/methylation domain-containing protein [Elusimicrobiaceae bacterium]|nr:prepilin-type N-terminal cleavage/methylation domain-containing protein [Elusimicrobiaceae bacterium]